MHTVTAENIKMLFSALLAAMILLATPALGSAKQLSVVYLNPASRNDAFFGPLADFMQAAADSLGIDLEIISGERSHVVNDELARRFFQRGTMPDYVIATNSRGIGSRIISMAEYRRVNLVLINEGLHGPDAPIYGKPGEHYNYWKFQYLPDDKRPGYLLAHTLIKRAKKLGLTDSGGLLHMVAVAGHSRSNASKLRVKGLQEAILESPSVRLHQIVDCDWKKDSARLTTQRLERYPNTTMVWAASDLMAEGVVKAAREAGLAPGKNLLTGGVDWTTMGLKSVRNGDFTASLGGHFMDGAWALVMIYDQFHGLTVPETSYSTFSVIDSKNVDSYSRLANEKDWSSIDFKKFSRHLNPSLKQYDFSLKTVLKLVR